MFSLFQSLTRRYLIQKWDRSLLVALSIALGVATMVSARILNQCIEVAALDSTVPADTADLYVSNGEIGVLWAAADDLKKAAIPGVKRVEPFIMERVQLPDLNARAAVIFGIDLQNRDAEESKQAGALRIQYTVINPSALLGGRAVAISRRLYDLRQKAGRKDGDPVEVRHTNVVEKYDLLAVIDIPRDSPIAPFADNLIGMELRTASKLIRGKGAVKDDSGDRVTRIDVFLSPGADATAVRNAVEATVGDRAKVRTPEDNRKSTEEVIGGIKIILNLCSMGALIVGLFLVYNALSVSVAERRHDIGVMRSLGATRPQIARLFAAEAVTLGIIGSLPGIPLGVQLSNIAVDQFGEELTAIFLSGQAPRPGLEWSTAVLAVLAGMATALLAALIPALQAASDEPADAVRRAPSAGRGLVRIIHRVSVIGLFLLGIAFMVFRAQLPSRVGSLFGMAAILTSLFLAMPIFVGLLSRVLRPLVRVGLGIEARLAADNLIRSPARTGVVIGALAAGVSLMFQTAGVGRSNEVQIREWLDQVIRADAYVFRDGLVSANSSMTPMDPDVGRQLRKIPGVESVVGLRLYRAEYGGTFVLIIGIDAIDYHRSLRRRNPDGIPAIDRFKKLPGGDFTVASDNFCDRWKVNVGETVTIPGPKGPVSLKVLDRGMDYSWSQGTLYIDREQYVRLFEDSFVDQWHVFFDRDENPEVMQGRIRTFCEENQLLVQNQASVRTYLAGIIDRLFRVAYMQQVIVAVVAALGVITALLISVLQRRRELGLLRAVGATQPQILKTVIAEAMLMGVMGTLLGFMIGLPMEWFILRVVMREESGFSFDLIIPWTEAAGIGLAAIITAAMAGLIPALHAARLRIPDAIAYE